MRTSCENNILEEKFKRPFTELSSLIETEHYAVFPIVAAEFEQLKLPCRFVQAQNSANLTADFCTFTQSV